MTLMAGLCPARRALRARGIGTLADLTVRVPRRPRWWAAGIVGLGASGARQHGEVVPLEQLIVPAAVDGSRGTFRGPAETRTLSAHNDYEAHQRLAVHARVASDPARLRKEAERR